MLKQRFVQPRLIARALIRLGFISVIFIYFLFAIIFISVPVLHNIAECDRLETNYVTCQQYETSIHLTIWAFSNLFSLPIDVSDSRFSYQLKGAEIYDGALYLETDKEPILYQHRSQYTQGFKYSAATVESFIRGKGRAKTTLLLENSFITSITYLFACLAMGALIIGGGYYLDKSFASKSSQHN